MDGTAEGQQQQAQQGGRRSWLEAQLQALVTERAEDDVQLLHNLLAIRTDDGDAVDVGSGYSVHRYVRDDLAIVHEPRAVVPRAPEEALDCVLAEEQAPLEGP